MSGEYLQGCAVGWPEGCEYHLPDEYQAWCHPCRLRVVLHDVRLDEWVQEYRPEWCYRIDHLSPHKAQLGGSVVSGEHSQAGDRDSFLGTNAEVGSCGNCYADIFYPLDQGAWVDNYRNPRCSLSPSGWHRPTHKCSPQPDAKPRSGSDV